MHCISMYVWCLGYIELLIFTQVPWTSIYPSCIVLECIPYAITLCQNEVLLYEDSELIQSSVYTEICLKLDPSTYYPLLSPTTTATHQWNKLNKALIRWDFWCKWGNNITSSK